MTSPIHKTPRAVSAAPGGRCPWRRGRGGGHTPAAPTGGTATPTETSRPPRGHRHSHGDTGILTWIRGHRDLTGGTGTPRGTCAPSGGHGGTGAPRWHRHTGIPTGGGPCAAPPAPSLVFPVPRSSNLRRAARWRLPGRGSPGSGPLEGRAERSSAGCVGRRGEWAASTVLPRGKPAEVPPLCEAAGPCPEGFLVRSVISITANYPKPAGRAGSAPGGPSSETPAHPEQHEMVREGREQAKLQPQALPGACTVTRGVRTDTDTQGGCVCAHTQAGTWTCLHTQMCVGHTQTCAQEGSRTYTNLWSTNAATSTRTQQQRHTWMDAHTGTHTHLYALMHTYILPCTPTRVPKCQRSSSRPSWGWAGGPDPAARPQACREPKASPLLPLRGGGSNPGDHG